MTGRAVVKLSADGSLMACLSFSFARNTGSLWQAFVLGETVSSFLTVFVRPLFVRRSRALCFVRHRFSFRRLQPRPFSLAALLSMFRLQSQACPAVRPRHSSRPTTGSVTLQPHPTAIPSWMLFLPAPPILRLTASVARSRHLLSPLPWLSSATSVLHTRFPASRTSFRRLSRATSHTSGRTTGLIIRRRRLYSEDTRTRSINFVVQHRSTLWEFCRHVFFEV